MQSKQLLTESEIFKGEVRSGTESTDNPSLEMSERRDYSQNHDQNLIEIRRLQVIHSMSARGFDEGQGHRLRPNCPLEFAIPLVKIPE